MMYIVSSLTQVWLSYEFCVLIQNPRKFSRGSGRFSRFVGRALQSFFLGHRFSPSTDPYC
jgi:hypothetical protein